jgi:hypothetical protein
MGGVSFLTPLDTLFVLAAALPLAAFTATERRAGRIRRLLDAPAPRRRTMIPIAVALTLLIALVAVAAAQPVVSRQQLVSERADAQAFFLFDTSTSMRAAPGPGRPSRLTRAKRIALRLRASLGDVPVGIASMIDRTLPNLLPTTDAALFKRTLAQSVAIDSPPPSQRYRGRATSFQALVPFVESHFYAQGVRRRLLIVFTDGEVLPISPYLSGELQNKLTPIFVHMSANGERIYRRGGRPDPQYVSDPSSMATLDEIASTLGSGHAYAESDVAQVARAARAAVGTGGTRTHVSAYARIALAPWFVLGGIAPLAFLLWRRNA